MASDNTADQEMVARKLAEFLTAVSPRSYSNKSPLQERMEREITLMAEDIASEVVAATPSLHAVIKAKTADIIQRALRDDTWLNSTVVGAVAKALGTLALERQEDQD